MGLPELVADSSSGSTESCWMPKSADKLLVLVIDALRFDFAKYHLPHSVGARLGSSKLMKFVADPPTVTMQRLEGLTTGSLPTFADISGNFGGAYIEEDAWIEFIPKEKKGFVGIEFKFVSGGV